MRRFTRTNRMTPYESSENSQHDTQTIEATFYVTEGTDGSILSWRTSEALELIKVARPLITQPLMTELISLYDSMTTYSMVLES